MTDPPGRPLAGEPTDESWLRCATCVRELDDDPDDDPTGDAGLPICGECDRAPDFDATDHD